MTCNIHYILGVYSGPEMTEKPDIKTLSLNPFGLFSSKCSWEECKR
jgi:hypothetical protein